jgi:hypothetical protein
MGHERLLASEYVTIDRVEFGEGEVVFVLTDGYRLDLAEAAFPTLAKASSNDRLNWMRSCAGRDIHWPELDLDISLDALIAGLGEATKRQT